MRFFVSITIVLIFSTAILSSCSLGDRVSTERTINNVVQIRDAEIVFHRTHGRYGSLTELAEASLISEDLGDGEDSGFRFNLVAEGNRYFLRVNKIRTEILTDEFEELSLFVDQTGIVRYSVNPKSPADQDSEEIQKKGK